jgi:hypothetical protein
VIEKPFSSEPEPQENEGDEEWLELDEPLLWELLPEEEEELPLLEAVPVMHFSCNIAS